MSAENPGAEPPQPTKIERIDPTKISLEEFKQRWYSVIMEMIDDLTYEDAENDLRSRMSKQAAEKYLHDLELITGGSKDLWGEAEIKNKDPDTIRYIVEKLTETRIKFILRAVFNRLTDEQIDFLLKYTSSGEFRSDLKQKKISIVATLPYLAGLHDFRAAVISIRQMRVNGHIQLVK